MSNKNISYIIKKLNKNYKKEQVYQSSKYSTEVTVANKKDIKENKTFSCPPICQKVYYWGRKCYGNIDSRNEKGGDEKYNYSNLGEFEKEMASTYIVICHRNIYLEKYPEFSPGYAKFNFVRDKFRQDLEEGFANINFKNRKIRQVVGYYLNANTKEDNLNIDSLQNIPDEYLPGTRIAEYMKKSIKGKETNLKFDKDNMEKICNKIGKDINFYRDCLNKNIIIERINTIIKNLKEENYYVAALMSFPIIDNLIQETIDIDDCDGEYPFTRDKREKINNDFGHKDVFLLNKKGSEFWGLRNEIVHGSKFEVKAEDSVRALIYILYSLSLLAKEEEVEKDYYRICKNISEI